MSGLGTKVSNSSFSSQLFESAAPGAVTAALMGTMQFLNMTPDPTMPLIGGLLTTTIFVTMNVRHSADSLQKNNILSNITGLSGTLTAVGLAYSEQLTVSLFSMATPVLNALGIVTLMACSLAPDIIDKESGKNKRTGALEFRPVDGHRKLDLYTGQVLGILLGAALAFNCASQDVRALEETKSATNASSNNNTKVNSTPTAFAKKYTFSR